MSKQEYILIKRAYSVQNKDICAYSNLPQSPSYIYLIAGVHGNEPEGVYVLEQLYAWCKTQNLSKPLMIIPDINPDGAAAKTRVNANGVDLNRNWPTSDWQAEYSEAKYNPGVEPLSEPENVFLYNMLSEFKPEAIISFHSWKPILNYNPAAKNLAEYFNKFNNYPMQDSIGYPTPGSLGQYATEELECPILTYELPEIASSASMQDIWLQNAEALQSYFGQFKR